MNIRIDATIGLKAGTTSPWTRLAIFLVDRDRVLAPEGPQVTYENKQAVIARTPDGKIRTGHYSMFANAVSPEVEQAVIEEIADNSEAMDLLEKNGVVTVTGWRTIPVDELDIVESILMSDASQGQTLVYGQRTARERPTHPAFLKLAAKRAQAEA